MREILFRGQTRRHGEKVKLDGDKVSSHWVYGGIFQGTGDYSVIYDINGKYAVYSDTVGQYTGLKDKYGERIFEGDIWNYKGYTGFIEWCEEVSRFEAVYEVGGMQFADAISDIRASTIEIIGNIYDNPELLKEGAHE